MTARVGLLGGRFAVGTGATLNKTKREIRCRFDFVEKGEGFGRHLVGDLQSVAGRFHQIRARQRPCFHPMFDSVASRNSNVNTYTYNLSYAAARWGRRRSAWGRRNDRRGRSSARAWRVCEEAGGGLLLPWGSQATPWRRWRPPSGRPAALRFSLVFCCGW